MRQVLRVALVVLALSALASARRSQVSGARFGTLPWPCANCPVCAEQVVLQADAAGLRATEEEAEVVAAQREEASADETNCGAAGCAGHGAHVPRALRAFIQAAVQAVWTASCPNSVRSVPAA